MVIQTACLDNPHAFAPTWHGGVESQVPWLDVNDQLPRIKSPESPALRKAWESVGVFDPGEWKQVSGKPDLYFHDQPGVPAPRSTRQLALAASTPAMRAAFSGQL